MFKQFMRALHLVICAVLVVQLTGCGTIMYPERKGQAGGKIDAGVAVLDAIGLLFFVIPGVIAFAIDFNNGTIYLPGTSRGSLKVDKIREVSFNPGPKDSIAEIEKIIEEETGYSVKLNQSDIRSAHLESIGDMMAQFVQIFPGIQESDRLVWVR